MADPEGIRKLEAILAADVAGYSRLMQEDEESTVTTLEAYRGVFREKIQAHRGRVVDMVGDSVLAVFESPVEAVECAVEVQAGLARRNRQLAEHRRMQFRIGLNLGDVITHKDGTIYGDGVNIAARLQSIADPGGISIAANVFDHVDGRLPLDFEYIGEQQVKNIAKPVRTYKVLLQSGASRSRLRSVPAGRPWAKVMVFGVAIALVASLPGVWLWRYLYHPGDVFSAHYPQDKPSIAVLPFVNIGGDPKQDYLSDGITEDITTNLARFTKLFVVARNSSFAYKGKAVDVRQVGKDLSARYVLEGSVRRSDSRARITAQLIDAATGTHIWAANYDRELKDLFNVQDEVIQQIVGRLDVELDRAQLEQAKRTAPKDFTAYDLVLQARKLIYDHSEVNHRESRDLLERAIAMDERLAPAYAELAWVYLDEYRFGWNARPSPLDRALKAASRAVELEPDNGFAHWRLAKVLFFRKELDRFEAEKQQALALNPNHAETLADVAIHLEALDRVDEAYQYAQRAVQLDPNLTWAYFVHTVYFYRKQRYREAVAAAQRINIPEFYPTHFWRAVSYAQLGDTAAAHKEAAEVLRLKPDFAWMDEVDKWNIPEAYATHAAEGAMKAGLPVTRGDK